MPGSHPARIAVIGDVHMRWDAEDEAFFGASQHHLVLCVGDLASYRRDGLEVATSLARLPKPALCMLGNHDGVSLPHLACEAFGMKRAGRAFLRDQERRVARFERALGDRRMGYSCHELSLGDVDVSVIGARPHSMGGTDLSFAPFLHKRFGVRSIEQSVERLCGLVDEAKASTLIFVGHNGPAGLGANPNDIWGCDFDPKRGDFGDVDLRAAIAHAKASGRRVALVAAGHMHHGVRGGGARQWLRRDDETLYVNAARVPRIRRTDRGTERHHVEVVLTAETCEAQEIMRHGAA